MPVPIAGVGRQGRMDLTFTCRAGQTAIRNAYCEVPFKVTRLHDSRSAGIAHLILMQCTAGVFGGDALECAIHVERGARVLLTQQSATKIHPSNGKLATQHTRVQVDAGGELRLYYDPVIPFAGSRHRQTTSIHLESGARLSLWEGFMSGRIGRGEHWQFDELTFESELRVDGRLLYLDRFCLRPGRDIPASEWAMRNRSYAAVGLSFGENAACVAERLHDLLPDAGVDTPAPDLVVARIVAENGPAFHRCGKIFKRTVGAVYDRPDVLVFG